MSNTSTLQSTRPASTIIDRVLAMDIPNRLPRAPSLSDPYYYFPNREGTHYNRAVYAPFNHDVVGTVKLTLPAYLLPPHLDIERRRTSSRTIVFEREAMDKVKGMDRQSRVRLGSRGKEYTIADIVDGKVGSVVKDSPTRSSTPRPPAPATPFCSRADDRNRTCIPVDQSISTVITADDIIAIPRPAYAAGFSYNLPNVSISSPGMRATVAQDDEFDFDALSPWVVGAPLASSSLATRPSSSHTGSENASQPSSTSVGSSSSSQTITRAQDTAEPIVAPIAPVPRHASAFLARFFNTQAISSGSDNESGSDSDSGEDIIPEDTDTPLRGGIPYFSPPGPGKLNITFSTSSYDSANDSEEDDEGEKKHGQEQKDCNPTKYGTTSGRALRRTNNFVREGQGIAAAPRYAQEEDDDDAQGDLGDIRNMRDHFISSSTAGPSRVSNSASITINTSRAVQAQGNGFPASSLMSSIPSTETDPPLTPDLGSIPLPQLSSSRPRLENDVWWKGPPPVERTDYTPRILPEDLETDLALVPPDIANERSSENQGRPGPSDGWG